MSNIKWENVPDSQVRAEVEAVLESQGEAKNIRQFLSQNQAMNEWRDEIRKMIKDMIQEKGVDNLTPDLIYDNIAAKARDLIPKEVVEEVKKKLVTFLQKQFEDHI